MADKKAPAAKAKRATRPAAERAQEALDAAGRVVGRVEKRLEVAKAEVAKAEAELAEAKKVQNYRAQNPDLPADEGDGAPVVDDPTVDS